MERKQSGLEYLEYIIDSRNEASIKISGSIEDISSILDREDVSIIAKIDANSIKAEEFKFLLNKTAITDVRKKLFIVENALSLKPELYNALLKQLEDPRGNFFILITKGELPPTIESRLIEINFENNALKDIELFNLSTEEKIEVIEKGNIEKILNKVIEKVDRDNIALLEEIIKIKEYYRLGLKVDGAILALIDKIN